MERVIKIQMRMLDNVIDLNKDRNPVPQSMLTNVRYRPVGAGIMDHAKHLINMNMDWESEEALEETRRYTDLWAFSVIKASLELAIEKGAYPLCEGSDWQTGLYFEKRGLNDAKWTALRADVAKYGVRNGYLMAIAPTGSIGQVAGCTEGINPNYGVSYVASKEKYKISQIVPGYNASNAMVYARKGKNKQPGANGNAYLCDQLASVKQNAIRQIYVDQAISFDLNILKTTSFRELEAIDTAAWESGMKTIYYTRNKSIDVIDCEFCQ